jgi:hypothetical protein
MPVNAKLPLLMSTRLSPRLLLRRQLSAHATAALYTLVERGDALVAAAFEVYRLDDDVGELVDTLLRIVIVSAHAANGGDDDDDGDNEGDNEGDNGTDGAAYEAEDAEYGSDDADAQITTWSELARVLVGKLAADRQLSANAMMRLLELIVGRDRALLGLLGSLIDRGAAWPELIGSLRMFAEQVMRHEANAEAAVAHAFADGEGEGEFEYEGENEYEYEDDEGAGSERGDESWDQTARPLSAASAARGRPTSQQSQDREVASVLSSPLSLREGVRRLLDMMLRDGSLDSRAVQTLMQVSYFLLHWASVPTSHGWVVSFLIRSPLSLSLFLSSLFSL